MKNKKFYILLLSGLVLILAHTNFSSQMIRWSSCESFRYYFNSTEKEIPEFAEKTENIIDFTQADAELSLYATSACLVDAGTNRVLYGKNAFEKVSMASTTKIMTCLTALEYGKPDDVVRVSAYASTMPDVQLNIKEGEQYYLKDLLLALMLESHNDVAVAIAEHISGNVEDFCKLMTEKAKALGLNNTSFKTPNGLDAEGHYTTAAELSILGAYAIKNEEFLKIIQTATHTFSEISGKRNFLVTNKNKFLGMMDGALGIKTGFTSKAGYCFVGAVNKNGKTFVSSVLASGWPPNKNYKWKDTLELMEYGIDNYSIYKADMDNVKFKEVYVFGGKNTVIKYNVEAENFDILLNKNEALEVTYCIAKELNAPVKAGEKIGELYYKISGVNFKTYDIVVEESIDRIDYFFTLNEIISFFI